MRTRAQAKVRAPNPVSSRASTRDCPIELIQPIRNAQEKLQEIAAVGACDGGHAAITAAEIRRADCRSRVDVIGSLSDLGGTNWNSVGQDFFFQGLIGNSHRQAVCRANFISDYATNAEKEALLNAKAKEAFDKNLDDLRDLVRLRDETEAFLKQSESDTRLLTDHGTFGLRAEGIEATKNELAEVEAQIARFMLAFPVGYDPDVANAYIEMARSDRFDATKLKSSLIEAQGKYLKAANYFQSKYQEAEPATGREPAKGNYCYGLDFKNMVGRNGEIGRWLKTIDDPSLRSKLSCQMTTFTEGRWRLTAATGVIGYAAMLFPAGRLAQAGTKAAWMVFGTATAAEAASTLFALNALREVCLDPEVMTSADQAACDPEKDFQREINPQPVAACAAGAALTAVGGVRTILGRYRQAKGLAAGPRGANSVEEVVPNAVLPRATKESVAADPKSFTSLTGKTADRVNAMAESGRLKLVRVAPGMDNHLLENLPVKPVPGRYYVVVKTKEGLVLSDYSLRHGGHRKLAAELGLPAPRKLDTEGTPAGGVVFYDDGVVVSGQSLRYPNQQSANDIARELKKMGFKILDKKAGPISGPNSTEKNPFDARNLPLGL